MRKYTADSSLPSIHCSKSKQDGERILILFKMGSLNLADIEKERLDTEKLVTSM